MARKFQERFEQSQATSVRQFCREAGKDWSVVSRHLRLLRLPHEIVDLLEQNQTPEILQKFTLKRLDALTRLAHADAVSTFMREASAITCTDIAPLA